MFFGSALRLLETRCLKEVSSEGGARGRVILRSLVQKLLQHGVTYTHADFWVKMKRPGIWTAGFSLVFICLGSIWGPIFDPQLDANCLRKLHWVWSGRKTSL